LGVSIGKGNGITKLCKLLNTVAELVLKLALVRGGRLDATCSRVLNRICSDNASVSSDSRYLKSSCKLQWILGLSVSNQICLAE